MIGLYAASRPGPQEEFGEPAPLNELNRKQVTGSPHLNAAGTALYFAQGDPTRSSILRSFTSTGLTTGTAISEIEGIVAFPVPTDDDRGLFYARRPSGSRSGMRDAPPPARRTIDSTDSRSSRLRSRFPPGSPRAG